MKNKSVLVTGGTGSIGSGLVNQLLSQDVEKVVVFSRDEIKQFLMKHEIEDDRVKFIMGDIRDYESIETVFERHKIDNVYHAAAMKHLVVCEREPIECSKTNIIGTHNLMRLCVKYDVPKVVTISTDKAASPTSVMGASKFIAERLTINANSLSSRQQKFCCVRFGNVANTRGSVIPIMVKRLIEGKGIWVSNPNVTRFIMGMDEAVKLVIKASHISQGGEIFVLKMPAFRLGDLADVIKNRVAPRFDRKIDVQQKKLVGGEKLHEDLLNPMETRNILHNEDLYIVLREEIADRSYPGFNRCDISGYNSSSARLLDEDEIEKIVLEYVNGNLNNVQYGTE